MVNEHDEDSLPIGLHLGQLLIYLIVPVTTLLSAVALQLADDPWIAMAIGGALPLLINLPIMLISMWLKPKGDKEVDSDGLSCCSKAGFLFLFPPKAGVGEVVLASLLTFLHGALMVWMIHPAANGGDDLVARIPHLAIIGLSSYSLFSAHCPEVAIYRDNDSELEFGSNHYQRSTHCSVIALALLIIQEGTWSGVEATRLVKILNLAFIVVYFL